MLEWTEQRLHGTDSCRGFLRMGQCPFLQPSLKEACPQPSLQNVTSVYSGRCCCHAGAHLRVPSILFLFIHFYGQASDYVNKRLWFLSLLLNTNSLSSGLTEGRFAATWRRTKEHLPLIHRAIKPLPHMHTVSLTLPASLSLKIKCLSLKWDDCKRLACFYALYRSDQHLYHRLLTSIKDLIFNVFRPVNLLLSSCKLNSAFQQSVHY